MKYKIITTLLLSVFLYTNAFAYETTKEKESKETMDLVMAFMDAMGKGEMDKLSSLMADDMVWHNEGDKAIPWIGPWNGKEEILSFLDKFSKNVQPTFWKNEDVFSSGDTAAIFGKMKLKLTKSGKETPVFTFALRVKVKNGKVVLWNWFEDSYVVSNAFHGK